MLADQKERRGSSLAFHHHRCRIRIAEQQSSLSPFFPAQVVVRERRFVTFITEHRLTVNFISDQIGRSGGGMGTAP
jgi:hypothetical protein